MITSKTPKLDLHGEITSMIEVLRNNDPYCEWSEVTIISVGDRVYESENNDYGEVVDYDKENEPSDARTDAIKELYLKILYNVPTGFELTAGITTNYRQLKTIYYQRRHHKLPEWHMICDWIEELPKFKELCLEEK